MNSTGIVERLATALANRIRPAIPLTIDLGDFKDVTQALKHTRRAAR